MKNMTKYMLTTFILLFFLACESKKDTETLCNIYADNEVHKLLYNNPGLLVDLDVGFKSVPMPMDFDGDTDLLISESGSYA